MKTTIKIKLCFAIIIGMLMFASCSKDRTEKNINTLQYAPLDDFYNNNAPEEQTFIIDSLGGDTIVGMQGTNIWGVPKTIFMYKSNYQDIYYPFTIKLIEAYSIKDMILSKLPNTADDTVLKCGGELKITAFKNSDELVLKNNCGLNMWAPSANPDNDMDVFYGFTNGTLNDWNNDVTQTDYLFSGDTVTKLNISGNGYLMRITKLGWTSIAHFLSYSSACITFTSPGNNTENIDIYIIFNNRHSFIKVNSMTASNLPSGEPITVFAIAKDTDGEMYYFKQALSASNGLQVDLNLNTATEAQILSMMESL